MRRNGHARDSVVLNPAPLEVCSQKRLLRSVIE